MACSASTFQSLRQQFTQGLLDNKCETDDTKREATTANILEIETLKNKFDTEKLTFTSLLETLRLSQRIRSPADDYMTELETQKAALKEENYTLQQQIRAGRRRFMSNDPNGGVESIGALKTKDDRILFIFWIPYMCAAAIATFILMKRFESLLNLASWKAKMAFVLGVMSLFYASAFLAIKRWA
jgi:hypothetical protein